MDPARMAVTLSMVLALAGIGGAFRACGSVARSGSRVSARAVFIPRTLPRLPARPRLTTAHSANRTARHGAALGALGDDAARGGPRAAGRWSSRAAGNADNLTGLDLDDEENEQRLTAARRRR